MEEARRRLGGGGSVMKLEASLGKFGIFTFLPFFWVLMMILTEKPFSSFFFSSVPLCWLEYDACF